MREVSARAPADPTPDDPALADPALADPTPDDPAPADPTAAGPTPAGPTPDELARRCAQVLYAGDRASQHLGMTLDSVGSGRASVRMRVTEIMINGHDICHGGYLVLLADSAFAFACNTYNVVTVAQGADVTFVESARLGDVLVADARERVRRGRSGLYDVTVCRDDGTVIAEFRGR